METDQFQVTQTHPKAKLPTWKRIAPTTQPMDTIKNGMQHLCLKHKSGEIGQDTLERDKKQKLEEETLKLGKLMAQNFGTVVAA